jgi:hypothetical protein
MFLEPVHTDRINDVLFKSCSCLWIASFTREKVRSVFAADLFSGLFDWSSLVIGYGIAEMAERNHKMQER